MLDEDRPTKTKVGLELYPASPAAVAAGAVQKAAPPAAPAPDRDAESRRLSEVLGALVADREQLVARIGAIERNLEDVTGSIQRQAAAAAAAPSAPAPPEPCGRRRCALRACPPEPSGRRSGAGRSRPASKTAITAAGRLTGHQAPGAAAACGPHADRA